MRFEGTRPSAKDDQIDVYTFSMGSDEALLIYELLCRFKREMPKGILDLTPALGRTRNLIKVLAQAIPKVNRESRRRIKK